MLGWIAPTDDGWYRDLCAQPSLEEVNFWRPSSKPLDLEPETPFFFKLKRPHDAICGFGYFARFSVLPDWLAWEAFGSANGVASLSELRARTSDLRAGARIASDPENRIGCLLIAQPTFFAPDDWVPQPKDWKKTTVAGATYDLDRGEGQRIWHECRARSRAASGADRVAEPIARYGAPQLVRPRIGQGIFRIEVTEAYARACAVTGEKSLPVLEAAHIRPYADGGPHDVSNGLLLRSDLHRLFDCGYVTVDDDLRFVVSARLRADYENGRVYYAMEGQRLRLPIEEAERPGAIHLRAHRERVFLG